MKHALVMLFLLSLAFAHSDLEASNPADQSTVTEALQTVTLTFSENVEPRFSTFVVYPLGDAGQNLEALEAKADELHPIALGKPDGNAVTAEVTPQEASSTINLSLPGLEPGAYGVFWRALSVDTHTIEDHLVFDYQPEN